MKHIILVAMVLLVASVATMAAANDDAPEMQMEQNGSDGGANALKHCEQARLNGTSEDAGQQATLQLRHRLNAESA